MDLNTPGDDGIQLLPWTPRVAFVVRERMEAIEREVTHLRQATASGDDAERRLSEAKLYGAHLLNANWLLIVLGEAEAGADAVDGSKPVEERARIATSALARVLSRKEAARALVRQCDGCGMTTAADLDPDPRHAAEMQMHGQTVREVTTAECLRLWQTAGPCCCKRQSRNDVLSGSE